MKSKYRFWDSVSRAGVGLTLVFITRIMRGQAWMHIGVPVACFSSGPHQLSSGFSYWPWYSPDLPYLNLLFLHLILSSITVGLPALLSISGDGNGHIVPMSPWCSLRQSPFVKCKPFLIFYKSYVLKESLGCMKNLDIWEWLPSRSQMPGKTCQVEGVRPALSIFKSGVQYDHCDQRFVPPVNLWYTVETIIARSGNGGNGYWLSWILIPGVLDVKIGWEVIDNSLIWITGCGVCVC